ncbi:HGGxSTG domain-containing protein [Amycolatopsis sp. NPDC051106]|uniref:HGGxSTG domain-containing protein n=1 Tax=unclassified Amycolatopsis TaxID=2618356 RepID=UPI00342A6186
MSESEFVDPRFGRRGDGRHQDADDGVGDDVLALLGKPAKRTCSARRTNGNPCKNAPINGANVCRMHGGSAPQVKAKAKARLEMAADRMAKELLRMAGADDMPPATKLAAIRDALDRAGLNAGVSVEVELKPFESILQKIAAGPRPGSVSEEDVIDAEIVEDDGRHYCRGCARPFPDELPPGLDAYPDFCRDCRESGVTTSAPRALAPGALKVGRMEDHRARYGTGREWTTHRKGG